MSKFFRVWMIGALAAVALATAAMSYNSRPVYAADDKNMAILIVDDSATMRSIEGRLLKRLGFNNFDAVTGGSKALEKLRAGNYALVISATQMSPMSGLELLTAVRADAKLKSIPFMVVVSKADQQSAVDALKAGANNYIVKPFDAATLKARMEAVGVY